MCSDTSLQNAKKVQEFLQIAVLDVFFLSLSLRNNFSNQVVPKIFIILQHFNNLREWRGNEIEKCVLSSFAQQLSSFSIAAIFASELERHKQVRVVKPGLVLCGRKVLWKDTSHVGCSQANCPFGTLLVCSYNPPAEYDGLLSNPLSAQNGGGGSLPFPILVLHHTLSALTMERAMFRSPHGYQAFN